MLNLNIYRIRLRIYIYIVYIVGSILPHCVSSRNGAASSPVSSSGSSRSCVQQTLTPSAQKGQKGRTPLPPHRDSTTEQVSESHLFLPLARPTGTAKMPPAHVQPCPRRWFALAILSSAASGVALPVPEWNRAGDAFFHVHHSCRKISVQTHMTHLQTWATNGNEWDLVPCSNMMASVVKQ